jgi:tetratricopeptide (TPR) repeat protein
MLPKNAFHSTASRRTLEGDPVDLGRTHLLLGSIDGVVGQNLSALRHLNTALAIFEQYDRRREIAILCCNLGDLYIRNAEYTLAQATLRRSLSISEQIGDPPIMSTAISNLGILTIRLGDLSEAESYFQRGLSLAEQVNDLVYTSLVNGYLATVMLEQGDLDGARIYLRKALLLGRSTNFAPCIGFSLVVLGRLRITQGMTNHTSYRHFYHRARLSLKRALSLEGLEAETRTEGRLAISEASFLLGEIDTAYQQSQEVLEEAGRYEQTWLLACAQRLIGSILSTKEQYEQADSNYTQALDILRKRRMRLEEARTLHSYGESLLQRANYDEHPDRYTEGLRYLQEARNIFEQCHAALDLKLVERTLEAYAVPAMASKETRTGQR